MAKNIRIHERSELQRLARQLGTRPDWHEPDEQEVTARVLGDDFDNAGCWGTDAQGGLVTYGEGRQELWVEISQDGQPVAEINLATLLALASEAAPGTCRRCGARESASCPLLPVGVRGSATDYECEDRAACARRRRS